MTTKRVSPDQGSFLVSDPITGRDIPNPLISVETPLESLATPPLDYDPAKYDPNPGLSTPLAEGWSMLHRTIVDIARARSNQGFMRLPEDSHPVKKFALQVDTSNGEAMDLVGGTVRKGSHYREAQHRLNFYRDKQIRRTLGYNAVHRIVPDRVITDLLPMDVGTVEHRFFYANNPLDARQKLRNRQYIARFVKTYGQ